jgi:glycogen operon protein
MAFVAELLALRRAEPLLRHSRWFASPPGCPGDACLAWYAPSGHEMQPHDWHDAGQQAFGAQLRAAGAALPRLMIIFNPETQSLPFMLCNGPWQLVLDSSGELQPFTVAAGQPLNVPARALLVLRHD